ncbi:MULTISPECIES: alpha/beta fold hydrolase [unclassified Variovorax]|uniref:alpha/beta fold hydrolase n=1 Tax=unclassified Variovorax TaxID=663243 RepID=UPI003F453129
MNSPLAPTLLHLRPNRFQPRRRDLLRAMALTGVAGLAACGGGRSASGTSAGPADPAVGTVSVTDRFVQVSHTPDVSLQVRDWQRTGNTGPTIVLLAGLGANARYFDSLAPALAADSRVVAISRRGYGLSDKPLPVRSATQYYDTDTLTADLKAVLDDLGLPRVVLAGHSIAGNELTRFAGLYPERVQGLVYLDTTFHYQDIPDTGGEDPPVNAALDEPVPGDADRSSLQAAVAFNRRLVKNWWPALEANLRESLDLRPDGSVRPNTPDSAATAMDVAAHNFMPDYHAVRAPSLVVTALPATARDLLPWLAQPFDATTEKYAADLLRVIRRVYQTNSDRLVAALNTPHRLTLDNACHADFLMEREAEVLRAIRFMTWA